MPAPQVPSWLVAFDVLICPHVVTEFTRSLDAIKAYEYLATSLSDRATPTSGFQELEEPGLYVGEDDFVVAVRRAAVQKVTYQRDAPSWDDHARLLPPFSALMASHPELLLLSVAFPPVRLVNSASDVGWSSSSWLCNEHRRSQGDRRPTDQYHLGPSSI